LDFGVDDGVAKSSLGPWYASLSLFKPFFFN